MDNPWAARCVNYQKCGVTISDTREAWNGVSGWERWRDQGGTNHIALRRPTGEFMCNGCMAREKEGLDPGQGELL